MNYALVENGAVTRVGLPQTGILKDGSTVSGYDLLDAEILAAEGWLPLVDIMPDSSAETFEQDGYTIEATRVVQKYKSIGLDSYKQAKIATLSAICRSEILSDFTSSALGVPHQYGFDTDDQTNIGGIVTAINAGLCPPTRKWRTNDAGALDHTIDQLKQLFADGMAHKSSKLDKYGALKDQINDVATDTKDKVDTIVESW